MSESVCEAFVINKHKELYSRAQAVGLTLKVEFKEFVFADVPHSDGIIQFDNLVEVERFLRGYELGYKSGL
ncbi:MAG: hypothetical protein KDJ97_38865 [Anaerolineae bacterium]|nr:hypothetical protein [Anaerolineae bacterium]